MTRRPAADTEAALLSDALDVPASLFAALSREPLGAGTVAGFHLPDETIAYVDTSGLPVRQETGLVSEGEGRIWFHPADPHLPALAPVAFGQAADVLLARLGITTSGSPEMIGYRPGRRAVLRVPTEDGMAWVKVVRPRRIERVAAAHRELRARGLPVPEVRGWSPDGLLVLDGAIGTPATEATWEPAEVLAAVDRLRDRLAAASLDWPARTALRERIPWYLERLATSLPDRYALLERTAASASALYDTADRAEPVTIHGDLHLGQLFLTDGEVTGLIDVDTAGSGDPAEDAAAFLAHALSSAILTRAEGREIPALWSLISQAHEEWEAPRVRALTAMQLLGHAVGAAALTDTARARRLGDAAARVLEPKNSLIGGFLEA